MATYLPDLAEIAAVLPDLRLLGEAGRGGMSVVYVAEQVRLRRRVALKVLTPLLAEDDSFRERFIRESYAVAAIDHPNVVPVYDAGKAGDFLYIVMRYVDGPDLKARLRSEGALPVERTRLILHQVARALDAAHARGIIHRDVKPANVLIGRSADGEDHCYLCDFGLAKPALSAPSLTGIGQFVGTVDYSAPEQIEGHPVDERTDVYALGCVLYECLAGAPPFRRDNELATIWAHLNDPPRPLHDYRPELPHQIDRVVGRALAKAPSDRFPTCRDLADAFGEVLPAAPRPAPTRTGAGSVEATRERAGLGAAPPASVPDEAPPSPRPLRVRWVAGLIPIAVLAGVFVAALLATREPEEGRRAGGPFVPLASGSKLVFVSERDGNPEIYAMNSDGSGRTRLTNTPTAESGPTWSPDGTRIAFVSKRDVNEEIYVMNANGSGQTRLTDHPKSDRGPDWSPDGTRIAFVSDRDGNAEIYVMNADGSNPVRLTDHPAGDRAPDWSPDGTKIVFVSDRDGNEEIYLMNGEGSRPIRLTTHPLADTGPEWSPDGTKIVFVSARDENREIYVMNADGSVQTRLTKHPQGDEGATWSPDGRLIMFSSDRDGSEEIYIMNADGSHLVRLTRNLVDDSAGSWGPSLGER